MIERYELNKELLPTVPSVHDCVIKKIIIDNESLTFIFEDDISCYDSIKYLKPNAKTLIIKYHLIGGFNTYKRKLKLSLTNKEEYVLIANDELIKMAEDNLEYLYENVGYESIILKLWNREQVVVDINVDYIEYEWIEQ